MTRHVIIFIITFVIGVVIAVTIRTSTHKPFETSAHPPAVGVAPSLPAAATAEPINDHQAQPTPTPTAVSPANPASDSMNHDHHAQSELAATNTVVHETVNTLCPGCGDPVISTLPYADYHGKKVGFACAMCPPKFQADPVKYGEAALKNQVAE